MTPVVRGVRPRISVAMPAYNDARYIDAAISSVLAQRGASFELLIGDDGSTDGTWGIIQRYRHDPRVRAWRFRHRGKAGAPVRNDLIARARGRYLSICDADDVMLPDNLRVACRLLDLHPTIGVVCPYWRCIDAFNRPFPVTAVAGPNRPPSRTWDLLGGMGNHGGSMIRRAVMQQVGGYREDLPGAEDFCLFLALAEITRIEMIPGKPLYCYRYYVHRSPSYIRAAQRNRHRAFVDAIRRRYGYRISW